MNLLCSMKTMLIDTSGSSNGFFGYDMIHCTVDAHEWTGHITGSFFACWVMDWFFSSLFWKSKFMHAQSADYSCGWWCGRSTWFLKKQMLLMHNNFVHVSPVVWVYLMAKKEAPINNSAITVSSCDEVVLSMCMGKAFCCFSLGSWFLMPLNCHFKHGFITLSCSPWKELYPTFALKISPDFAMVS